MVRVNADAVLRPQHMFFHRRGFQVDGLFAGVSDQKFYGMCPTGVQGIRQGLGQIG